MRTKLREFGELTSVTRALYRRGIKFPRQNFSPGSSLIITSRETQMLGRLLHAVYPGHTLSHEE
jgi:hypothetical protein